MEEPTSGSGNEVRVVLITAPDADVGRRLARALVERGLAACVNSLPGILSTYRWEGEIQEDEEVLLIVKTTHERWPAIQGFVQAEHPYDTPECVALEPAAVESKYAAWVAAEVGERG